MIADFTLENHGSILLLRPNTPEAQAWVNEHFSSDNTQMFSNAIAVAPRYVSDIVQGIVDACLTIEGQN